MDLTRRVRALELRRDRERVYLVRADSRWRAPEFRESVRVAELRMFRDALTTAQARRATDALLALVREAVESIGIEAAGRMTVDALRTVVDGKVSRRAMLGADGAPSGSA